MIDHGIAACAQERTAFEAEVIAGLSAERKSLSSRWLYDFKGSLLFDQITALPEYYPSRAEVGLLTAHAARIAQCVGAGATVVEFGSGSSRKTALLLQAMRRIKTYIPVDISRVFLDVAAEQLRAALPGVEIAPVCADMTSPADMRKIMLTRAPSGARLGVYLGSSLGNFTLDEARDLLARMAEILGPDAWLLLGADSTRDEALLLPAYNDAQGITARFNLNLLERINRELGGDFNTKHFVHGAWFVEAKNRIEMHLISRHRQSVRAAGRQFMFYDAETLHTENCHKYSVAQLDALGAAARWHCEQRWTDASSQYSLSLLRRF